MADIDWAQGALNNGVIYADIPQALQGLVDDITVTLNGNAIAVEKVLGEQGIQAVGFAIADFAEGVNQLVLTYLQADLSETQQSQYIFKETNLQTSTATLGVMTFADSVVSYAAGNNVTAPYNDPLGALGQPNDANSAPPTPALGNQGVLVVGFTVPLVLTGNHLKDVWVFEVGGSTEATAVEVSDDGVTWFAAGTLGGGVEGIDVDALTSAPTAIQFVRITDLLPAESGSPYAGADIDAIGLIQPLGEWRDNSASSIDHASSVSSVGSSLSSSLSSTSMASLASLSSQSSSGALSSFDTASSEGSASSGNAQPLLLSVKYSGPTSASSESGLQFSVTINSATVITQAMIYLNDSEQFVDLEFDEAGLGTLALGLSSFNVGENTLSIHAMSDQGVAEIAELNIYVGSNDAETFTGQIADTVYVGSVGDDLLYAASGVNTYEYNLGDGHDTLFDTTGNGIVLIHTSSTNVSVEKVTHSDGESLRLIIPHSPTNGSITLVGQNDTTSNYKGIASVKFDDGVVWQADELVFLTVVCQGSVKTITGTTGNDEIIGKAYDETLNGGSGDDVLLGNGGCDVLSGGDGNDVLDGGAGNDSLVGGTGSDLFIGGPGNEIFISDSDSGNDTYIYRAGDGNDTFRYGQGSTVSKDVLKFESDIAQSDIRLLKRGENLVLDFIDGSAFITFEKWFASIIYQIPYFQFGAGDLISKTNFLSAYPLNEAINNNWSYTIVNPNDYPDGIMPDYSASTTNITEWLAGVMPFGSEVSNSLAAEAGFPAVAATNWPINTDLWLHKDITLKAGQYLELELFIDNNLRLWVNGKEYFNNASTNVATDFLFKLTIPANDLLVGKNRLVIKAHDFGGYAYASAKINIVTPPTNQKASNAPSWLIPTDAYAAYGFDGNAIDWTKNGHDGQVFGTVAAANYLNVKTSAYAFRLNDSEIYLSNTAQFSPSEFTMSAWIFPDAMTENGQIIGQYNDDLEVGWYLAMDAVTQQLTFNYSNQNQLNTIASELLLQHGQWQFISVIYSGTDIKLFINGEEAIRADITETLEFSSQSIVVGNGIEGEMKKPFIGIIDDLVIWERALKVEELIEFYRLQMPQAIVGDPFFGEPGFYPVDLNIVNIIEDIHSTVDPHWANVSLMLDFEGSDENTIFADTSTANAKVTAVNQARRTTQTFAKNKVASFDGDFDSLTVKESPMPPVLGTTFTVETWVYINQLEPINNALNRGHGLWSESCNGGTCEQGVAVIKDGRLIIYRGGSVRGFGSWSNFESEVGVIKEGEWTHIAHSFDGLTHRMFVNGKQVITFEDAKGWYHPGEPFRIGQILVPSYSQSRFDLNGYLDNFRVTRGVVRYSQDFTPPLNPNVLAAPN